MKSFFLILFVAFAGPALAQLPGDSLTVNNVTVEKDPRIDILGRKMAEFNESIAGRTRIGRGYRLMVISTNDREQAMKVRSNLYRLFPDHKQYMSYQLPNIKIKFGNFVDKDEAEKFRKLIIGQKLVENNIYILPEMIEIKPEKKETGSSSD